MKAGSREKDYPSLKQSGQPCQNIVNDFDRNALQPAAIACCQVYRAWLIAADYARGSSTRERNREARIAYE
jgi:hypothetical protein